MCMEDIRIGRNLLSQVFQVNCAAGVLTTLWGANPDRVAITFSIGTNATRIGPSSITLNSNTGIFMNASSLPWTIRVEDIGNVIQQAWSGFSALGGVVTIIESVLNVKDSNQLRNY